MGEGAGWREEGAGGTGVVRSCKILAAQTHVVNQPKNKSSNDDNGKLIIWFRAISGEVDMLYLFI